MEKVKQNLKLNDENLNDLKEHYYSCLKDETFKSIVDVLDCDDDVKMRYTSTLMDSANEFKNCMNCKNLSNCKNKELGFRLTPTSNKKIITFDYIACPYKNKEIKDNAYLSNIEVFEMTNAIKNATIKNIYTDDKERLEIIKYFKYFIDNFDKSDTKGLYLNGSFGTGKTYLIAALFNEMAKRGIKSAIVYYPEFLRSLKESFDSIDYKEKFNYIKNVPLLLIDDIGAEAVSSWSRDEILGSIIQYRMEQNLKTFFTSNLTLKELEEHLSLTNKGVEKVKSRRIMDRINYITKDLKLVSKNRREKNG